MISEAWAAANSTFDKDYILPIFNFAMIVVLGVFAWLVRRAITNIDEGIKKNIEKSELTHSAINDLKLLLVGDYITRKEYTANMEKVQRELETVRERAHELSDQLQPLLTKVAILEGRTDRPK